MWITTIRHFKLVFCRQHHICKKKSVRGLANFWDSENQLAISSNSCRPASFAKRPKWTDLFPAENGNSWMLQPKLPFGHSWFWIGLRVRTLPCCGQGPGATKNNCWLQAKKSMCNILRYYLCTTSTETTHTAHTKQASRTNGRRSQFIPGSAAEQATCRSWSRSLGFFFEHAKLGT